MIYKTIVIFANSSKHGDHCVAGKCVSSGVWIRPVSNENGGALSRAQAHMENIYGRYLAKPLQKIEMAFDSHNPLINQPENYMISDTLWRQRFKIDENELHDYLDRPNSLWGNGNRVSYSEIEQNPTHISQSLYLIQATHFELMPTSGRPRAKFSYSGHQYNLVITDPYVNDKRSSGIKANPILCVSLGERYYGYCYKLVANIF